MQTGRRAFGTGWGLAWGLVALLIYWVAANTDSSNTSVTVHADGRAALTESARLMILLVGSALAAALGVFVALKDVRITPADRGLSAFMWATIAAAVVAANWYLADHNGPDWWYRSVSRLFLTNGATRVQTVARNPWMVHLVMTLPIAGALGGLAQYLAMSAANGARRASFAIVWTLLWGASFLLARYLGVILVYISVGLGGPLGAFAGGFLTGFAVGMFLSFSPGLEWQQTAPNPSTEVPAG